MSKKNKVLFLKDLIKNFIRKSSIYYSDITYNRELRFLIKNLKTKKKIDFNKLKEYSYYWGQISKKVNTDWLIFYSSLLFPDIKYVPKNVFHNVIEVKLNNRIIGNAYRDKNLYEKLFNIDDLFPNTIFRNIEGFFYDKNYKFVKINESVFHSTISNYNKLVIKPSIESSSGRGVRVFNKISGKFKTKDNETLSLAFLNNVYEKNYIIQEGIEQLVFFNQFNPSSVNTVRIHTYRSVNNDNIYILNSLLRIGKKGSVVDNISSGGVACKIDENGLLVGPFRNKTGVSFNTYNNINLSDKKYFIPQFMEMQEIAKKIAKDNFYSRLLGFDFTIDKNNKVRLIEINNQYATITFQMITGPFFGNFTDEIIEFCKNKT